MSGFAGWIDWEKDLTLENRVLERMGDRLTARGPSASGIWLSVHAGLAHRRLHVPMVDESPQPLVRTLGSRTYALVYNGRLYNADELRQTLMGYGHRFESGSEAELLLLSYVQWGISFLERLNGMFALAIWDEHERQLLLARDRVGARPLFYAPREQCLLFGSELKALLAHPLVQPVLDSEGLAEVLALGPARTPGCGVFKNVHEVLPGQYLLYSRRGIQTGKYWELKSHPHPDDFQTTLMRVRQLLVEATERQLDSPKMGSFLSGGLDSSLISAVAKRHLEHNGRNQLVTFSVDYQENELHFQSNEFQPDPDSRWIPVMVDFLQSEHLEVVLDNQQLYSSLIPAMRRRDLPGMADIDSSLYLFCQKVRQHVPVALSGEGADEVFGGYPWFFWEHARSANTFPWATRLKDREHYLSEEVRQYAKTADYVRSRYQEALEQVPRLKGESPEAARQREISYLTLTHWMPVLLDRKDRMSMGVGLEVRVPFLDHHLMEYVWNIPWEMKAYQGQSKGILRQAMQEFLPPAILQRKKSPYPKTHNPWYLHATRRGLMEILSDPQSPIQPLVHKKHLQELMKQAESAHLPWFGQLMNVPQLFAYLIQLHAWLKEYQVRMV